MFFIFDLDGTLADVEHRAHYVRDGNRQWDRFFAECVNDPPIREVITVLRTLVEAGHRVEIWSGRSDAVRKETEEWLDKHIGVFDVGGYDIELLPASKLLKHMRPAKDFQSDTTLKEGWLNACDAKPDMIFDDRQKVVDMWRKNGVRCAQVAPGDFDDKPTKATRPRKPSLIVLIGPSGAGKSTMANMLNTAMSTPVVSADQIRWEQFRDDRDAAFTTAGLNATFSVYHAVIKGYLDGGVDVIADATHLKARDRKALLKAVGADTGEVNVCYVLVDRPLAEKLRCYDGGSHTHTNEDVIRRHHQTFQSSVKDALAGDGFDFVTVQDRRR